MVSTALRVGLHARDTAPVRNGTTVAAVTGSAGRTSRGSAPLSRAIGVSAHARANGSAGPTESIGRRLSTSAPEAREVLATVAHELRTPLASVAVSSELLVEDVETLHIDRIRRMASVIHSGALWLQQLLENLLCAATIDDGHFRIQPAALDLADLLADVRAVVDPLLCAKGQRLLLSTPDVDLSVSVDARRIAQVLVNLISNASKFAPPRTTIEIGCATRGAAVRVSVADRGPGIRVAAREQLFAPFCRGAEAERSGAEGVGLGLAIVKSIVEAHGGRVGADNRRGGGSSFWFDLPLANTARTGSSLGIEKEGER